MKKHGIFVERRLKFNTKKIYNEGYLLVRYLYQPHDIQFKNDMVNDINQHYCGGWSLTGLDLSNKSLLDRVLCGSKPMAVIHEWKKENLKQYIDIVDENMFYLGESKSPITNCSYITVACKGKLKDLFDLDTLENDYLINGIKIDTTKYKDNTILDFFDDWDAGDDDSNIDFWLTGLMLGYPIENTISIYKNGVR